MTGTKDVHVTTYHWLKNENELFHETLPTLSFRSLTLSDEGNYTCTVTTTSRFPDDDNDDVHSLNLSYMLKYQSKYKLASFLIALCTYTILY